MEGAGAGTMGWPGSGDLHLRQDTPSFLSLLDFRLGSWPEGWPGGLWAGWGDFLAPV